MPMMPPPGFPPPYPPPRPSRTGLWIFLCLASLAVLAVGLGLVLIGIAASSSPSPNSVVTDTLQPGTRDQTIAVIPVSGLIVDETETLFRRHLAKAAEDENVRAIVLDINSPGGTVTDSDQMHRALLGFKNERKIPVVARFDAVAASGGYYLACGADHIVAEPTTITGSIGVLIQFPQLSEFAEKTGIRLQTIVSDGSPRKDFLDTFREPDEQDLTDVRALLNEQYELFRKVVETGRGGAIRSAGSTVDEVADGAVYVGDRALALGLVDTIGGLDAALGEAANRANLTDPRIVRYSRPPTLAEQIGLASGPALGDVKLDTDAAAGLVVRLLHEATAPRALFLYRGVQ